MDDIGFVGLGSMGEPMAWNLHDAGFDLRVYNRTREKAEPFGEAGATVCSTPREAAEASDAVAVIVTDTDALEAVLGGDDGILAGIEGSTLIQMSTVARETTLAAASAVEDAGGTFVDAPVSGTVGPAEEGTLTVLAGGDDGAIDAVEPALSAMGDPIVRCGAVGQGTDAKIFVNLLLGDLMESFAEALAFGEAHDLDFETMTDVVDAGAVAAPMYGPKGEQIRTGDFEPRFALDLLSKDLGLAVDAADEADVPLPATAATHQAASAARALGHGEEDMAALIRHLEALTGREVRGDEGERDG